MNKLPIPADVLKQNLFAGGKPGSGKSSKLRVLIEWLLAKKMPVTIIDPKGDWWGVKLAADGKSPGFPVVIFGGEHADIEITEHDGAKVAEVVAAGNHSCLIDLGGWMPGQRSRFFVDFASTLFRLPHPPMHLLIDEYHNFAPQGRVEDPTAGKCLHWAIRLGSEGRSKGITVMGASQRPQKVHKDFITTCETLVACRVIHELDRDAMQAWMAGSGNKVLANQILNELANMPREYAWVWSPEIGFGPERVQFPMFTTYDSFSAQANVVPHKLPPALGLDEIRAKMTVVAKAVEAKDPKALKARIADLEKQVSRSSAFIYTQQDMNSAVNAAKRLSVAAVEALSNIAAIANEFSPAATGEKPTVIKPSGVDRANSVLPAPKSSTSQPASTTDISPTTRRIIDTIHRSHPVALSFEAAATRAGVSKRSSAIRLYKKQVQESGELVQREDGRLTSAAGFTAPAGAGVDPIQEFSNKLPKSYASMLQVIASSKSPLSKAAIADRADVSPTSSGLSAGLRELMALGLIQEAGGNYSLHSDLSPT